MIARELAKQYLTTGKTPRLFLLLLVLTFAQACGKKGSFFSGACEGDDAHCAVPHMSVTSITGAKNDEAIVADEELEDLGIAYSVTVEMPDTTFGSPVEVEIKFTNKTLHILKGFASSFDPSDRAFVTAAGTTNSCDAIEKMYYDQSCMIKVVHTPNGASQVPIAGTFAFIKHNDTVATYVINFLPSEIDPDFTITDAEKVYPNVLAYDGGAAFDTTTDDDIYYTDVTVTNYGNADLPMTTAIWTTNTAFNHDSLAGPPAGYCDPGTTVLTAEGGSCLIRVLFEPTDAADYTDTITFAGGAVSTAHIFTGTGVELENNLTANTLAFGTIEINTVTTNLASLTTQNIIFTVPASEENTATATDPVAAQECTAFITGAQFNVVDDAVCDGKLPGETCTLAVTFDPGLISEDYSETLTYTCADSGLNTTSGRGGEIEITLTATSNLPTQQMSAEVDAANSIASANIVDNLNGTFSLTFPETLAFNDRTEEDGDVIVLTITNEVIGISAVPLTFASINLVDSSGGMFAKVTGNALDAAVGVGAGTSNECVVDILTLDGDPSPAGAPFDSCIVGFRYTPDDEDAGTHTAVATFNLTFPDTGSLSDGLHENAYINDDAVDGTFEVTQIINISGTTQEISSNVANTPDFGTYEVYSLGAAAYQLSTTLIIDIPSLGTAATLFDNGVTVTLSNNNSNNDQGTPFFQLATPGAGIDCDFTGTVAAGGTCTVLIYFNPGTTDTSDGTDEAISLDDPPALVAETLTIAPSVRGGTITINIAGQVDKELVDLTIGCLLNDPSTSNCGDADDDTIAMADFDGLAGGDTLKIVDLYADNILNKDRVATFTITNIGEASWDYNNATGDSLNNVVGDDLTIDDSNCDDKTLTTNQSCTITVTYDPDEIDDRDTADFAVTGASEHTFDPATPYAATVTALLATSYESPVLAFSYDEDGSTADGFALVKVTSASSNELHNLAVNVAEQGTYVYPANDLDFSFTTGGSDFSFDGSDHAGTDLAQCVNDGKSSDIAEGSECEFSVDFNNPASNLAGAYPGTLRVTYENRPGNTTNLDLPLKAASYSQGATIDTTAISATALKDGEEASMVVDTTKAYIASRTQNNDTPILTICDRNGTSGEILSSACVRHNLSAHASIANGSSGTATYTGPRMVALGTNLFIALNDTADSNKLKLAICPKAVANAAADCAVYAIDGANTSDKPDIIATSATSLAIVSLKGDDLKLWACDLSDVAGFVPATDCHDADVIAGGGNLFKYPAIGFQSTSDDGDKIIVSSAKSVSGVFSTSLIICDLVAGAPTCSAENTGMGQAGANLFSNILTYQTGGATAVANSRIVFAHQVGFGVTAAQYISECTYNTSNVTVCATTTQLTDFIDEDSSDFSVGYGANSAQLFRSLAGDIWIAGFLMDSPAKNGHLAYWKCAASDTTACTMFVVQSTAGGAGNSIYSRSSYFDDTNGIFTSVFNGTITDQELGIFNVGLRPDLP